MRECVVPGSFDPITCGHISLVERTAKIYDSVTVAVMVNISKNGLIPYEERIRIIQKASSQNYIFYFILKKEFTKNSLFVFSVLFTNEAVTILI